MWQSSSASDDFEPKLSLIPLIFGSIKATLYSMIFGVPVALLAAIYTSEFLDPRWKSWVKPTIELMASLPSVVLGFLAALVFAPYIEKYLAPALTIFFTIPLAFLVGAYIWQLLPRRFHAPERQAAHVFVLAALPFGVVAALAVGPAVEAMLFGSDLNGWLNGLHPRAQGRARARRVGRAAAAADRGRRRHLHVALRQPEDPALDGAHAAADDGGRGSHQVPRRRAADHRHRPDHRISTGGGRLRHPGSHAVDRLAGGYL
jgi:hypothetical protein